MNVTHNRVGQYMMRVHNDEWHAIWDALGLPLSECTYERMGAHVEATNPEGYATILPHVS